MDLLNYLLHILPLFPGTLGCYRGMAQKGLFPDTFESFDPFAQPIQQSHISVIDSAPLIVEEQPPTFIVGPQNVCGDLPKICTQPKCRRRILCSRRCQRIQDDCTNNQQSMSDGGLPVILETDILEGGQDHYEFTQEYSQAIQQPLDHLNGIPTEVNDLRINSIPIDRFEVNSQPMELHEYSDKLLQYNVEDNTGFVGDNSKKSDDDYYWMTKEALIKQSMEAENQRSMEEPGFEAISYSARSETTFPQLAMESPRGTIQLIEAHEEIHEQEEIHVSNEERESHTLNDDRGAIQLGPEDLASILESIGAGINEIPEYNLIGMENKKKMTR